MEYSDLLRLLCDILSRLLVPACTVSLGDPIEKVFDKSLKMLTDSIPLKKTRFHEHIGTPEPKHIYKMTDSFDLCYIYFSLPETDNDTILFIGPYITEPKSQKALLELEEKIGISPKFHNLLADYFSSVPCFPDSQHLLMTVEVFAERIWKSSLTLVDKNNESDIPLSPINEPGGIDKLDNTLIDMSIMERRYRFENEMMQAVSQGQLSKADLFFDSFNESSFEKRLTDPVRNLKNYCIIMNTLLRKAAERGGVHPIYLDSVSSNFAAEIEKLSSVSEGGNIMREMFRAYCRLVRKHSMKNYSPPVRKAIVLIESDLSADLTLSAIASVQSVSPGYLSTVFKKETGKTITEFIAEKRIKYATHLLRTTRLQIQTVALHCGIMDVQYFSKIFKKYVGKTPKEFREANS